MWKERYKQASCRKLWQHFKDTSKGHGNFLGMSYSGLGFAMVLQPYQQAQ